MSSPDTLPGHVLFQAIRPYASTLTRIRRRLPALPDADHSPVYWADHRETHINEPNIIATLDTLAAALRAAGEIQEHSVSPN
ncbi:hypothetical protein [Nocardia sp. NPDC052566]|uniref:hypothetical protein n=1 Tax=Nocardia sp. NPDC052566 TaxID=3364330 RepID=UPI0037C7F56A